MHVLYDYSIAEERVYYDSGRDELFVFVVVFGFAFGGVVLVLLGFR